MKDSVYKLGRGQSQSRSGEERTREKIFFDGRIYGFWFITPRLTLNRKNHKKRKTLNRFITQNLV